MPHPITAIDTLDREFLTARAKLIELAAAFDRLDRAEGSVATTPDRGSSDARWRSSVRPTPIGPNSSRCSSRCPTTPSGETASRERREIQNTQKHDL